MVEKRFDELREDALLAEIDDLLRKRLDLVHDLIEVLARGIIRIERQLDRLAPPNGSQNPRSEVRDK